MPRKQGAVLILPPFPLLLLFLPLVHWSGPHFLSPSLLLLPLPILSTSSPQLFLVSLCVCVCMLNCVRLFATPCTVALQAPLTTEFSRQEYWSGLPFPSPGDLPNPRIEPASLVSLYWQAGSLAAEPPGKPLVLSGRALFYLLGSSQ